MADTTTQVASDEAAALGYDEDEAAFKAKLAVIARQKPKSEPTRTMKKSSKQAWRGDL